MAEGGRRPLPYCFRKAIMKTDRFLFIKELLTEQMNHWFLFPLALVLMGVVREPGESPNPALWLSLSVLPLIFYALRRAVEKFSFLLLAHIVAAVLFISVSTQVFPDDGELCVLCILGCLLHSFFLKTIGRQSYTKPMPLPWGVGISAAAVLIQRWDQWLSYYCFALIAAASLFLVLYYMDHYLEFLSVNKSSTGYIPASEMLHSGLGLVIGYSLLGAALMLISTHFSWTLGFLGSLKNMLIRFLRGIFSNLFREEDVEKLHPSIGAGPNIPSEQIPVSNPFWLLEVLWQVVEFVFAALLLFTAVKLLIKLIRWLGGFMNRAHSEDIQGEEAFDVREKCDLERGGGKKPKDLSDVFSHRERIRRLYKKKILAFTARTSERAQGRLDYYTAREWEQKIESDGMADIYERARYSQLEMTAEDVKKMKEACKM